ncbi:protoporphyrinogen oxidase [Corynebacterium propinquum]|uniref:protoporphyrinogen oxidase n=1 Tax=Corynebacterium propinquum TaxID=43769 RepID=UPI0003604707|nr:protoporphyrinogen oxidase [Corynebacterium propinquum]MDK4258405.1 protoporphyrinogen oxidase [Corynebacterium propinquum]MDK4282868.1 protoporphyrinogen oxidase [Corynebacterium propinquum]MDK4299097.1 protoporphyrinogen oxidase [Corynebacterium propinquum]MDK4320518.1 protoporphyrinogen oxidase [Corynebacterium propinquum]MDK8536421.1 protoporphyrinogen oxidase [Corynebacterium propinquum]
MTRCAIIGAGLAGLTAAYQLRQELPSAQIDVWEGSERIGGKLHTVPFDGGPVDMGAEAFLARRDDAHEFFAELGLADEIVYPSGLRPVLYAQGAQHVLPAGGVMGIPASGESVAGVVSPETVAAIDAEAQREPINWEVGGDQSLGLMVRDRYGDEVVDRCVSALLGGVYSCGADDLGIRATVPALANALDDLARAGEPVTLSAAVARVVSSANKAGSLSHDSSANQKPKPAPVFGTFRNGYATLYERLAQAADAEIYLETFVTGITEVSGPTDAARPQYRLVGMGVDETLYDAVLVATPAPMASRILKSLPGATAKAAEAMSSIKLASSAVVGLRFASDVDPDGNALPENSGILVAADQPGVTAKAFTLSSRKWPHVAQQGTIVRASFGRFGEDAITRAQEDELVDHALDDLAAITGFDGRAAGVEEIYTQRWFGGLPRYDHTHTETVRRAEAELADADRIAATGAWAGGVGVPAVIAHARKTARDLARQL